MTLGVGLFGTITAFLANAFVGSEEDERTEASINPTELIGRMDEIVSMLLVYEKTNSDLKAKYEGLEVILEKREDA